MAARRHKHENSSYRVHGDKYGCPPPVVVTGANGKPKKVRPEHGKSCTAPWAYAIDKGIIGGRRVRHVVTAGTKVELLAKVDALKEKQSLGVTPNAQTVGGWLDYWIRRVAPERGTRATTIKGYQSKITLYLKPGLGHVKLQDLTPDHVERWQDWMRTLDKSRLDGSRATGPLSDTTIRQAHMVLRSALADALTRRKVTYNAAEVVKAPKAEENPHEQILLDEAKAVLKASTTTRQLCRNVVALALGLRQGEALGLRWVDYRTDGLERYLLVEEAVQRIDGKLTRTDVKSKASHRRVPIPERMVPVFNAWQADSTDPYMFPGPNGGPCDNKRDWKDWQASLVRAGVGAIPLHGARGSAASLLADMGVPDWRIAVILGQSQVAVTRKHYLKSSDAANDRAIAGLIGELLP